MDTILNFTLRILASFLLFPITSNGFVPYTIAVTKDYSFREQSQVHAQTKKTRRRSILAASTETQEEVATEFRNSGISEKRIVTIERSLDLPFSAEIAYDAYSNLPRQPSWSSWLHKVEYTDASNKESLWTLKFLGFKYSWSAISLKNERPTTLQWKSTSGLANFGTVVFTSMDDQTTAMSLTMTLVAPRTVASLFRKSKRLQEYIGEKMVATSLDSFRDIVLNEDAVVSATNETARS
ncbi:unnamed protein product [Cylindrotheca closterium]|uniref:Coenzyme Q-binding protein COQ10 START domain-containing protein n=1 Tax=Cylindrotheca closterium TaxID=2856 RepID=A0AAD2CEY9_9STRA|nr:unnamed protein product [Cylindrotheca closterium]